MLSFRNANAGDLYVNRRGLGYWRIVRKLGAPDIGELYVNWNVSGYQRFVHKSEYFTSLTLVKIPTTLRMCY